MTYEPNKAGASGRDPLQGVARAERRINTGIVFVALLGLLVVIGLFVWAASSGKQTADSPAAQTTTPGAGALVPPPGPKK
jgi:hypothetical protein